MNGHCSPMDVIREKWGKGNAREGKDRVRETSTHQLVERDDKIRNWTPSAVSKPWHFTSTWGERILTRKSGGCAANRCEKVEGGRYSPENMMSERVRVGGGLLREEEERVRSDEWAFLSGLWFSHPIFHFLFCLTHFTFVNFPYP